MLKFFKYRHKKRGYYQKIPSFLKTKHYTLTIKLTKNHCKYIKKYELSVLFDQICYV